MVLLVALSACQKKAAGPDPVADVAKRVDAVEMKVGNVQGTTFNGGDISVLGIQPKFAVTMREYGDRFANMFYAAKNGNWALAAYMDHYMRGAVAPVRVTKPKEYATLASFHKNSLDPLLSTIGKMDFAAFQTQYTKTIGACNDCHAAMGYPFIVYAPPTEPANKYLTYTTKSKTTDFKEFVAP